MAVSLKTGFRRLPLLIPALLLLLPLCACTAERPETAAIPEVSVKGEAGGDVVVSEEKSPWGSWGAILPVPEGELERFAIGNIYRNYEQEIIIQYSFGPRDTGTTRFYNFSQNKIELECTDQACIQEVTSGLEKIELGKLEKLELSLTKYTMPEGGVRKRISGGAECDTPMDVGYEILLPNGEKGYRKIIWVSSEKYNFEVSSCDERLKTRISRPEYIRAKAIEFDFYSITDDIILGEGSYIRGSPIVPVIVLFKKDLTSPFFENQTQLFNLDGDLADSIYRVCSADARVKNDPALTTLEAADACVVETLKNGISDEMKAVFEKKLEQFYVEKQANDNLNIGEKWGAFLPLPDEYRNFRVSRVFLTSNQEIIILYAFSVKEKENRFWRIYNFSQDVVDEYQENAEQSAQHWIDEKTAGLNAIRSIDSSFRDVPTGEGFGLYTEVIDNIPYALQYGGYKVFSPNGDVRYEKVIWVTQEKHEYELLSGVALDIKTKNYIHLESPSMIYYKLDEKTLLGHGFSLPIVIIFRNDMTSPFFDNNSSFIQIDSKNVKSVYQSCISHETLEVIENADKCFFEFLKGEYPWLQ